MKKSIRILLLCSLAAPATMVSAQAARAPTANEVMRNARKEIERSRDESRKNLDDGVKGKKKPTEIRRARDNDSDSESEEFDQGTAEALNQDLTSSYQAALKSGSSAGVEAAVNEIVDYYSSLDQEVSDQEEAFEADRQLRAKPKTPKPKPKPKETPPEEEDESDEDVDQWTDDEVKQQLEDSRSEYDRVLRRRDEARIRRDNISENDRREQIIKTNEDARRAEERVRNADEQYRRRLKETNPAEYERYDQAQRDLSRRDFERNDNIQRDMTPGLQRDQPGQAPALQEYDGPNGKGPGAPPEGPSNPLGLKDYSGPQGQQSERRLEGGQDAYQADRVIAPGLRPGPAPAPAPAVPPPSKRRLN